MLTPAPERMGHAHLLLELGSGPYYPGLNQWFKLRCWPAGAIRKHRGLFCVLRYITMRLPNRPLHHAQAQAMFLEQEKKLPAQRRATASLLREAAGSCRKSWNNRPGVGYK